MNNEAMVPFTKVWPFKDGKMGQKEIWFNPTVPIKMIEECKIKNNSGAELPCTKIYYDGVNDKGETFILLLGSTKEFFKKCDDAAIAICLVREIFNEELTIKQFLKHVGSITNGADFM